MKKVLVFTLLYLTTAFAIAQSYQNSKTRFGRRIRINHENGKSTIFDYNNDDKEGQSKCWISGRGYHKLTGALPQSWHNRDGKTDYRMTLRFDKSMLEGSLFITNNLNTYTVEDVSWSGDYLTAELFIPENTYEILAIHLLTYEFVFLAHMEVTHDVDTTISFDKMAKHQISFSCYDENGTLVDPNNPSLIRNSGIICFKFPEPYEIGAYLTSIIDFNLGYLKVSDIPNDHKIFMNQNFYESGKMNITDFEELNGISHDTIFRNDPSDYKNLQMILHASPASQSNFINIGHGIRNREGKGWIDIISTVQNSDYPSHDKDTLQVYMANTEHMYGHDYMLTFVPGVYFWEDIPEYLSGKYFMTDPFFVTSGDSVVFAEFNKNAASAYFADGEIADVGPPVQFFRINSENNVYIPNSIYISSFSQGQLNEKRNLDLYESNYKIRSDSSIIDSGDLSWFTEPFVVTKAGEYSVSVTSENYALKGIQGSISIENEFDLGNPDSNPPVFSSFRLLNSNNAISNTFAYDETATLQLSTYDIGSYGQMGGPDSVEAYFKIHHDTIWTPLETIAHPQWYDANIFGYFYTADISGALSLFTGSAFLDIKIKITDDQGNNTIQTWQPVAWVVNNTQYENDMALTTVISPVTGEDLGQEDVTISIKNVGTTSQANIPVHYRVDDEEIISEIVSETILPGDSIEYTFSVPADLSAYNTTFAIQVCTGLADDENPLNDCKYKEVTNYVFPKMVLTPTSIVQSMLPNTLKTIPVILANNGNLPLEFSVGPGELTPCTEDLYIYGCAFDYGLSHWEFANINVDIECTGSPIWYHDFTDTTHLLTPGETYTLNIETGNGSSNFDIWIDFDDDLQLTDNEIILDDGYIPSGNTTISYDITIPLDATTGNHIMRVRANNFDLVSDPCESYMIGNCCDFTANIGTSWLSTDITNGTVGAGQSQPINVTLNTNSLEPGSYEKVIPISTNDPYNTLAHIPVTLNVLNQPWSYTVTDQIHTINVPVTANPNIFGDSLEPGDWIGVFFITEEGNEGCGGAAEIDATGGATLSAYGNDVTSPNKDGFDTGERFRWKIYDSSEGVEYQAGATYDTTMPNQGKFANFGLSKVNSLDVMNCQYYSFLEGWNSISSYVVPFDFDVENLFAAISDELTIVRNLTTIYWPDENVNTIGNFDNTSGYTLKVNQDTDFDICGNEIANREINLVPGWYYLPVISECNVNTMDFFDAHLDDIMIIHDMIGTGIFWPSMGIFTLESLIPGNAYKIKVANEFDLTFPDCAKKAAANPSIQINKISTPWGDLTLSPTTQISALTKDAMKHFFTGDMIGAFGRGHRPFGYLQINSTCHNQSITLFGNDETTTAKTGFFEGEMVRLKLYRSTTDEIFDLKATYDPGMENSSGYYQSGSLAAITNIQMNNTETRSLMGKNLEIYPNPASDELMIKLSNSHSGMVFLTILDTKGKMLTQTSFVGKIDLDVSKFPGGIYFVKINTNIFNEVHKIIIR